MPYAFCRHHRLTEPLPYRTTFPSIPRLHRPLGRPKPQLPKFSRLGLLAFTLFTAACFLNAGQRLRFGRPGDLSTSPAADSGSTFRPQVSDLRFQTSALRPRLRLIRTALFSTLITILFATLLELLQLALPNRSADWRDILWATLGALTTTLLPAFILKLPRR